MNEVFLAQIRAKAQQGIANRLFKDADQADALLREFGSAVAAKTGAVPIYGPLKAREGRATEKVQADYGGDWYELKDVVRMTLIASSQIKLREVAMQIRTGAAASEARGLIKCVETLASIDPCGYSGLNFVVCLKNGRPAEIQVNVAEIMYCKMSQRSFTSFLGAELYAQMRGRFRLEGGLGHALYEIYRGAQYPRTDQMRAALLSQAYYAYFRGHPNMATCRSLRLEFDGFKRKYPCVFH